VPKWFSVSAGDERGELEDSDVVLDADDDVGDGSAAKPATGEL